jgi:hypothetical protein
MAQPRVFVSHSSEDAQFANRLSDDLRASGADVWLDSSHMASGDFVARINQALANRDVVVLVLTPAALKSQWVTQEFNAAITRVHQGLMRQPIVIMARPCPPSDVPPLWNVYHRYDATNDYTGAWHGVARELGLSTPMKTVSPGRTGAGSTAMSSKTRQASPPQAISRGERVRYVKISWSAASALILWLILYAIAAATDGYRSLPGDGAFLFPLYILGAILTYGSWIAAALQMGRRGQGGWVFALAVGVAGSIFALASLGQGFTGVLLLALFPCAFTLAVGLVGSTSKPAGK